MENSRAGFEQDMHVPLLGCGMAEKERGDATHGTVSRTGKREALEDHYE